MTKDTSEDDSQLDNTSPFKHTDGIPTLPPTRTALCWQSKVLFPAYRSDPEIPMFPIAFDFVIMRLAPILRRPDPHPHRHYCRLQIGILPPLSTHNSRVSHQTRHQRQDRLHCPSASRGQDTYWCRSSRLLHWRGWVRESGLLSSGQYFVRFMDCNLRPHASLSRPCQF